MNQYALITGASKGIGKAFAEELAKKGFNLLLIARSKDLLEEVGKDLENRFHIKVEIFPMDLSNPKAPLEIFSFCQSRNLPVSILINNAGYGIFGEFETTRLDQQLDMLNLNILTLVSLSHLFIPVLKKQEKSYIMNIGSTAAYQTVPHLNTYSASKAFVLSFSRGLSYELKGSGISVTCLCPGSTKTDFMNRAGMKNPKIISTAEKLGMTSEEVAKDGLKAMFEGNPEYIPGFVNWLGAFGNRFMPKSLVEKIAAGLYKD